MTKFLIIFAICTLIGGVVVRADKRSKADIVQQCAKEYSITKDALKYLDVKKFKDIVPSENLKCLTRCVMRKTGILKADKLNEDKIRKIDLRQGKDAATAQAKIDACKGYLKGAGTCDEAWDLFTCFIGRTLQ